MNRTQPEEQVKYWVMPHLNNLELLHATYIKHSFSKHVHDGFAIGIIEHGALKFFYRGANVIAPSGYINLVIPGEAHDGYAATNAGWTYRMFYLEPALLEQAVYELSGKTGVLPFFNTGVIKDDFLAALINNLHHLLETPGTPLIEQESLLLVMLTEFIARHADETFAFKPIRKETPAVRLIREYIKEAYAQNISIQDLSRLCSLSPFHLIRVFKDSTGVPPHIYLKQVRIKKAKALLASGVPAAVAALETGFTDQSHFTKQFKQITGLTPGYYSNIIQDGSSYLR